MPTPKPEFSPVFLDDLLFPAPSARSRPEKPEGVWHTVFIASMILLTTAMGAIKFSRSHGEFPVRVQVAKMVFWASNTGAMGLCGGVVVSLVGLTYIGDEAKLVGMVDLGRRLIMVVVIFLQLSYTSAVFVICNGGL
ncbi:hypothetical protein AMTRI_Chr05g57710 [Amborella trichopoda]